VRRLIPRAVRIDVAKSASHHLSQSEIASDNPCSRHLRDYLDQRVLFYKTRDEKELIQSNGELLGCGGRKMRNLLIGVPLGILIVAVPTAFTQQQSERIQLGTDLQIGMAKDAVISKLTEHGYVIRKLIEEGDPANMSPDIWGVARSNDQAKGEMGTVTFSNGRLSRAIRTWTNTWDPNSAKLGDTLFSLVQSFEHSGHRDCTLKTESSAMFSASVKTSLIRCGSRTISVRLTTNRGSNETQIFEDVE
jgi:hypothetical protein